MKNQDKYMDMLDELLGEYPDLKGEIKALQMGMKEGHEGEEGYEDEEEMEDINVDLLGLEEDEEEDEDLDLLSL